MKHIRFKAESQAGWLVTLFLIILIVAPLSYVLIQVIVPGIFFGDIQLGRLDLLLEVFNRPFWQRALQNSLLLSISTAILGAFIGTVLAIIRSRWEFPTAKWLDFAVWLLFISPSFIIAQGWVLFAAKNGGAEQLFGTTIITSMVFNPMGLIIIMTLSKFPLAYLAVQAALKWQVSDMEHAAKLTGASTWRTWNSIHLPLLKPAIASGILLVFMDTIGDFGLPAAISTIYRFPTLPYAIYSAIYTSPIRFDMAGVLSFYLVFIILIAIIIQSYILKGIKYDRLTARATYVKPVKLKKYRWAAVCINLLILFIIVGIPIGSTLLISLVKDNALGITLSNFTFAHYAELFNSTSIFMSSLLRSLKIASVASIFALILGLIVSYVLIFASSKMKQFIETVSFISLAVPGVVLGIGYIFFWNQKWLEPLGLMLYGTPSILIIATIAGAIPIIIRIISGSISAVPKSMLDAAQLQGANLWGKIFLILLPLCKSAIVIAGLSAFGASVFDLAVNTILYPTNHITLPVTINKAFEDFKFGYASAATILGGLMVTVIIIVLYKLLHIKVRRN